jgi:hypothetical protein
MASFEAILETAATITGAVVTLKAIGLFLTADIS